jgi:hypothetical protein
MRNIEVMISDGMLGPKSVLLALSALTTGNLNSKLRPDTTPYKMQDILPFMHEYIIPPLTEEEKFHHITKNLMAFTKTAPNSPKFKGE